MITRARTLWNTVAPIARPALAIAAVGWGLAQLGRELANRRDLIDQLTVEAAARGRDLHEILGHVRQAEKDLQLLYDAAATERQGWRKAPPADRSHERTDEEESPSEAPADVRYDVVLGTPVDEHDAPLSSAGVAFG